MKLKNIIGMNLKYYRYQENKTQEQYYENMGLNYKYLSRIEQAKINITVDFIEEIANKLSLNVNDLITYNKKHEIKQKRIDQKRR